MLRSASRLDEKTRLAGLHALGIMDTPREERFDRITRLATKVFGVPAATISFVDENREWFKAADGWALKELPRDVSLAQHALEGSEPWILPDTRKDADFAEHPLVASEDGIAFYAACPVRGPDGGHVGVIAVLDERPRRLNGQDRQVLMDLAHLVEEELGVHFGAEQASQVIPADHALKMALEGIPCPAAVLDDEGTIRCLNAPWRDALRPGGLLSPLDDVGRNHLANLKSVEGFCREDAEEALRGMQEVLSGRRDQFRHDYEQGSGDDRRACRLRATPMQVEGRPWLLVLHEDRTDALKRRAAESAMAEYGMEVEQVRGVIQFQRRILDRYEQEMSAPATPIRLQLHMLLAGRKGELSTEQQHALETIQRNVERWNDSVHDMLQTLRRAGDPDMARQAVDLPAIVADAADAFSGTAIKEGIRLLRAKHPPAMRVEAAPQELRQVMSRFLERALAGTPAGGEVHIRMEERGGHAVVEVRDGDAGASARDVSRLFAPSADSSNLGLYWCKRVIDRHGGKVWAQAGQDGVTVGFRIPLLAQGDAPIPSAAHPGDRETRPDARPTRAATPPQGPGPVAADPGA